MFREVSYHATHTQAGADGNKFQCKMTNGVMDPETSEDWAMVADGTICGPPNTYKVYTWFDHLMYILKYVLSGRIINT